MDIDHLSSLDKELYKNLLYLKTYDGDDFTRRVKRIVETCEVVTSSGISNKIPGTNMSIGGRNKGKIDCN